MRQRRWKVLLPLCVLVAAVSVVAVAAASNSRGSAVITPSPAFTPTDLSASPGADWVTAGGGLTDQRFSTLNQINTTNVSQLQVAWHTHMGIPAKTQKKLSEEGSVISYGGTLFATDGSSDVYALDGATGAALWSYKPVFAHKIGFGLFVNRGLGMGAGNVYEGILDGSVVALNQQTGAVVWRNQISDSSKGYSFTAAPVYYNGMVIIGVSGGDAGARGYAIALNAATGQEIWRWYVTPAPGEPGSETWPKNNEWKHGGALWIYPSIDAGLGLVYIVTGNPVPWNTRGAGADLYTDSIVALNVNTGKLAWYFQTVHHDVWDYDVTNPPILFDAPINGVVQHGIAVASKTGWVYLLDRATGKPLLGIPEKKVGLVKGASKLFKLSPTQPFPVGDPFVNQCSTRAQWPTPAPDGKLLKVGCIFQPYSVSSKGSFLASAPSATGGTDWAPSAYNPATSLMYLCVTDGAGGSLGAETPEGAEARARLELHRRQLRCRQPRPRQLRQGRRDERHDEQDRLADEVAAALLQRHDDDRRRARLRGPELDRGEEARQGQVGREPGKHARPDRVRCRHGQDAVELASHGRGCERAEHHLQRRRQAVHRDPRRRQRAVRLEDRR